MKVAKPFDGSFGLHIRAFWLSRVPHGRLELSRLYDCRTRGTLVDVGDQLFYNGF